MKTTGRYSPTESDFDIDHVINNEVEKTENEIKDIKFDYTEEDAKSILKAKLQTFLNELIK